MREAFEKWWKEYRKSYFVGGDHCCGSLAQEDYLDADSPYMLIDTQAGWAGWQAAYKQAIEDAARVCDRFAERQMHPAECAAAIRKLAE